MLALGFILFTLALFSGLLVTETRQADVDFNLWQRGSGLLTWFISGNWPAKVGALLLMLGIGALIRYSFAHIDVAPPYKLFTGILATGLLGAASHQIGQHTARRAISLALAGAGFGVAYLTAYSAFVLFSYFENVGGITLLSIVAVLTAGYALMQHAVSIAVLSMIGAFLAPAFSIAGATPTLLFSYYIMASLMTACLVYMGGWRMLIHLSFLFTLAGSAFLGWSYQYYSPAYYDSVLPMLLILTAIHIALPFVEQLYVQRQPESISSENQLTSLPLDDLYTLALPLASLYLFNLIVPSSFREHVHVFWCFAGMWGLAGGVGKIVRAEGSTQQLLIALIFVWLGLYFTYIHPPLALIALGTLALVFIGGTRLTLSHKQQNGLIYLIGLTAFFYIIESIYRSEVTEFSHLQQLGERWLGILLLFVVVRVGKQRGLSIMGLLVLTLLWATGSFLQEIVKLHLPHWQLSIHAILLIITFGLCVSRQAQRLSSVWSIGLSGAVLFSAYLAQTEYNYAWLFLIITPLSLLWQYWVNSIRPQEDDWAVILPALFVPCATMVWGHSLSLSLAENPQAQSFLSPFFVAILSLIATLLTLLLVVGKTQQFSERHTTLARALFFMIFIPTAYLSLFHVEKNLSAITYDLLALLILFFIGAVRYDRIKAHDLLTFAFFALALHMQALLLRWFGQQPVMSIFDLDQIRLPAAISLLWISFGALLTYSGAKITSRQLWIAGAALLIVGAVKTIFFDFGALGELGNIIATILAGLIFMTVAWLAPFPPKAALPSQNDAGVVTSSEDESMQFSTSLLTDDSSYGMSWLHIFLIVGFLLGWYAIIKKFML